MSSVQRYRNLIVYLTQIYSAQDSTSRTALMQEALNGVMTTLAPSTNSDWEVVLNDVRRLLNVWEAKETDTVARCVVLQIEDMLKEFSQITKVSPKLMISETVRTPVISHVEDHMTENDEMSSVSDDKVAVEESDEEEAPEPEEEETLEEEVSEEEAPEPDVAEDEEEEDTDPEPEESVDDKEASEEEAEAEMEVEQITVRGKTYWHDAASGKLFAVIEDDEVGDEIGILVNGKIQTLVR